MNTLDDFGLTPFLAYVRHFCSTYHDLRADLVQLLNTEAARHGKNFGKYRVDNFSLFNKVARAPAPSSAFGFNPFNNPNALVAFPPRMNAFGGAAGRGSMHAAPAGLAPAQTEVSQVEIADLAGNAMELQVVAPFVEMLKVLIRHGADPGAQVQKVKAHRERDERRRKRRALE